MTRAATAELSRIGPLTGLRRAVVHHRQPYDIGRNVSGGGVSSFSMAAFLAMLISGPACQPRSPFHAVRDLYTRFSPRTGPS